jgi:hypothetical protein
LSYIGRLMNSGGRGYPQGRVALEGRPQIEQNAETVNPNTPKTSTRLSRAAAAERGELARHRERLISRRDALRAELDQIERALVDVDERSALLDRLAPAPPDQVPAAQVPVGSGSVTELPGAEVLRGTAIRETAVRLLAGGPDATRPVHYKRIYELLGEAGYAVAGKDPLATFLTQLSRSPVMRKTTEAGVYQLDPDAPDRLRRRLSDLQAELRAVTANPTVTDDLAEVRRRREQVLAEVAQAERALEEVARVLAGTGTNEPHRGAA